MKKLLPKSLLPYQQQIVILIVAVTLSCAMLAMSYSHYSQAQQNNAQLLAQQSLLSQDIEQLIEDKKLISEVGDNFNYLQAQGFFGDEDRLSWGEALKITAQRLKLPSLKYSIRPQQQITNIGGQTLPSLQLSQSIMDIEAELMHEGDFMTLSEQLSRLSGLFRVQDCQLDRVENISTSVLQKNINLKCSLAWHTVKHVEVDDAMPGDEFNPELFE